MYFKLIVYTLYQNRDENTYLIKLILPLSHKNNCICKRLFYIYLLKTREVSEGILTLLR